MFLLHIEKNKIKKNNLLQILHLRNLKNKIKKKLIFFKKLKELKQLKFLKTFDLKYQTSVKYIIGITIYNTNTSIYLSDIKGTVKFFCSAGLLYMKRKERKKTIVVIIKLIKFMLIKIRFISKHDLIALHLKNFRGHLSSFTLRYLLKYYNIELLKVNNNQPHNGCRPRKLKRKKKQKLIFNLKN